MSEQVLSFNAKRSLEEMRRQRTTFNCLAATGAAVFVAGAWLFQEAGPGASGPFMMGVVGVFMFGVSIVMSFRYTMLIDTTKRRVALIEKRLSH